ncbi:hypothetical protein [Pseudomonas sp. 2FE]|uniref:hypothetical protein n=1 Tax=Pseudomonas sp. 2FE TaxID=2502190 RepID=UPI0010FA6027|nr:hypothetical protein [Pseudomonas sp. 2FE]
MKRSEPLDRDRELWSMATIDSQLPVSFENGQRWSEFKGLCRSCNKYLPVQNVRGVVLRQARTSYTVEAVGHCPSCNTLTRFLVRLHDDARVTGPMDGEWRTWHPENRSWLRRALKKLRKSFSKR